MISRGKVRTVHTGFVRSMPGSATLLCFGALVLVLLAGCSSSQQNAQETPEQRLAHAKGLFDDGDYLEAINEFTALTLQYQGSSVAAEAQFSLGECRFNREEYLLAAYEFGVFKRSYGANPKVPEAQFKLAMAYYNLSPKPPLDQQYTKKAIDEFQTFAEYYPAHALAPEADTRLKELNGRLAKKAYETARLYVKMEYIRAALLSYDQVIERYHDTEFAPIAYIEKVELLMGRERYEEAYAEIQKFLGRYPTSPLTGRAEELKDKLSKELNRWKRTPGGGKSSDPSRAEGTAGKVKE
jgi:outer membrane protein assembly factor BamD